jgi:hypothetical protein
MFLRKLEREKLNYTTPGGVLIKKAHIVFEKKRQQNNRPSVERAAV